MECPSLPLYKVWSQKVLFSDVKTYLLYSFFSIFFLNNLFSPGEGGGEIFNFW